MKTDWKRRGFTLVELAIGMVIVGLMVGLGLGPAREHIRNLDLQETREDLERARAAVVQYAIARQTEERILQGFGELRTIPAGRPYLPCPDINGDGEEDRRVDDNGNVDSVLQASELLNLTDRTIRNGACLRNKGLLPWRTLQTEGTDKWGMRFTYRVDPNFSHAGLGFGYRAEAETADRFQFLENGDPFANYPNRDEEHGADAPAVVCLTHDCLAAGPAALSENQELDAIANIKIGGVVYPDPISGQGREYDEWDVHIGAVFVILSHGRNRLGGVNADNNRCVPMDDDDDLHELQNAFYAPTLPDAHPLVAMGCYSRPVIPIYPADGSTMDESVFVERPPYAGVVGGARTMDDVLTWMSAPELTRHLANARADGGGHLEFLP